MHHHLQCFFVSAFYGGHAQGVFGRAGFLTPRSTNLRMAATHSFGSEGDGSLSYGVRRFINVKNHPRSPRARRSGRPHQCHLSQTQ
ncbi:hypothetical protein EMIT0P253_80078 [Pseudomonas sp. IT-P253]